MVTGRLMESTGSGSGSRRVRGVT